MKYKVCLTVLDSASSPKTADAGIGHSFYTKSQAVACCEAWRDLNDKSVAYLWDGSTWTQYYQIP